MITDVPAIAECLFCQRLVRGFARIAEFDRIRRELGRIGFQHRPSRSERAKQMQQCGQAVRPGERDDGLCQTCLEALLRTLLRVKACRVVVRRLSRPPALA